MSDQKVANSEGCGGSEWSLQRCVFHSVLGQASRAFSSISMAAPNCRHRAVRNVVSIGCSAISFLLCSSFLTDYHQSGNKTSSLRLSRNAETSRRSGGAVLLSLCASSSESLCEAGK